MSLCIVSESVWSVKAWQLLGCLRQFSCADMSFIAGQRLGVPIIFNEARKQYADFAASQDSSVLDLDKEISSENVDGVEVEEVGTAAVNGNNGGSEVRESAASSVVGSGAEDIKGDLQGAMLVDHGANNIQEGTDGDDGSSTSVKTDDAVYRADTFNKLAQIVDSNNSSAGISGDMVDTVIGGKRGAFLDFADVWEGVGNSGVEVVDIYGENSHTDAAITSAEHESIDNEVSFVGSVGGDEAATAAFVAAAAAVSAESDYVEFVGSKECQPVSEYVTRYGHRRRPRKKPKLDPIDENAEVIEIL
jgi:hypothetical protein